MTGQDPSDGERDDEDLVQVDEDTLEVRRRPTHIAETLQNLARRRGWRDRLEGAGIFRVWEQVVGGELAGRCEPVRLAGGRLVIRAENAAWATQVRYLTTTIIERTDQELRPGLVTSIDVVVGDLRGSVGGARDEP